MKTKYKKVQTSERLPEKRGKYLIYHKGFRTFLQSDFEPDDIEKVSYFKANIEFWLEEVTDMEDEMRGMLDRAVQYLSECDWHPSYVETYSNFVMNVNELLTKLKTES